MFASINKKAWRVLPVTRSTAWGSGICPSSQERATHRNPRRWLYNDSLWQPMWHIYMSHMATYRKPINHPWASTVALSRDWILKLPDFRVSRNKAHDKRFPINSGSIFSHFQNPLPYITVVNSELNSAWWLMQLYGDSVTTGYHYNFKPNWKPLQI